MNAILELRKELKISQYKLAEILGVTRSRLSMMEMDRRPMQTGMLIKLGQIRKNMDSSPDSYLEAAVKEELAKRLQDSIEKINLDLERKHANLLSARRKLEKMQGQHHMAVERLRIVAEEKNLFADIPTYLEKLDERFQAAQEFFLRTHEVSQQELLWKIKKLETAIEAGEKEIIRIQSIPTA